MQYESVRSLHCLAPPRREHFAHPLSERKLSLQEFMFNEIGGVNDDMED